MKHTVPIIAFLGIFVMGCSTTINKVKKHEIIHKIDMPEGKYYPERRITVEVGDETYSRKHVVDAKQDECVVSLSDRILFLNFEACENATKNKN